MSRVLLFIASLLFATLSFGQKVIYKDSMGKKWQVYNHDTIAYTEPVVKDTASSIPAKTNREVAEKKPVVVVNDTLSGNQANPPKEVLENKPVAIAKDTLISHPGTPGKEITGNIPLTPKKDTVKKIKAKPAKEVAANNEPPLDNRDLFGKWQMESTEVADGYYYTYAFAKGNTFIFANDENEGLNRIISLRGTYYLRKDTLIIYVKEEYDLVGGAPQMSKKQAGSGWEIKGGKVVPKDLPVVQEYKLPIRPCEEKDNKRCIEINSMSYYKLE